MYLRSIVRTALVLWALSASSLAYALPSEITVALTALSGKKSVVLTCAGEFALLDQSDTVVASLKAGSAVAVSHAADSIILAATDRTHRVEVSCTLKPMRTDQCIAAKSPTGRFRSYRGAIGISVAGGSLRAHNRIDVESYLRGVVPLEMPCSYPEEALKAQAVAARTYVYRACQRRESSGRELCDAGHCQVYGGVSVENPRCDEAVRITSGTVLTYRGALASTMYCSDSGGATANYLDYYPGTDFAYLASVPDPEETEHVQWRVSLPSAHVAERLARNGFPFPFPISEGSVKKTDANGRAVEVEFVTQIGKMTVPANKLRAAVGNDIIRSTFFTLTRSSDGRLEFRGQGYGHGFGMSQRGAMALALPPHNYDWQQILAHYYPGTQPAAVESVTDATKKRPYVPPRVGRYFSGKAQAPRRIAL
jgi:SpoIID/LytB domain protein